MVNYDTLPTKWNRLRKYLSLSFTRNTYPARRRHDRASSGAHSAGRDSVVTPMQGTVLAVEVAEGDEVRAGQVLCIVEAMKMENEITAHRDGVVTDLSVEPGQPVQTGQIICVVTQKDG